MQLSDNISYLNVNSCPMCGSEHQFSKKIGRKLSTHLGLKIKNKAGVAVNVFRCTNCLLIYANPQPVSNGAHYKSAVYNSAVKYSQIPYPGSFEKELNILSTLFARPLSGLDALDLGFGYGNAIIKMKQQFKSVQGIEPFDKIFEFAIMHPELQALKSQLQKIDFSAANFKEASVDFIFFEAFQHIAKPDDGLKKALTWLKPKGIIYLEVPSSNWLIAKIINTYYKVRGTDYITNLSPLSGNFTNFEFSHKSFEKSNKSNGYKILQYEYIPCETMFKGAVNRFVQFVMRITNTGMQLGIYLQKN